jgi:hypothetical protein
MRTHKPLDQWMARLKMEVCAFLPNEALLSEQQCRQILARYAAAIEPNFTYWLSAAVISAKSLQGRFAACENLEAEIKENHRGMLRAFVAQARALPDDAAQKEVQLIVNQCQELIGQLNGTVTFAVMAILENTSALFIPFIERIGKRLGVTDLTYTRAHGEADIEHANQFIWALEREIEQDDAWQKHIAAAELLTKAVLETLFHV